MTDNPLNLNAAALAAIQKARRVMEDGGKISKPTTNHLTEAEKDGIYKAYKSYYFGINETESDAIAYEMEDKKYPEAQWKQRHYTWMREKLEPVEKQIDDRILGRLRDEKLDKHLSVEEFKSKRDQIFKEIRQEMLYVESQASKAADKEFIEHAEKERLPLPERLDKQFRAPQQTPPQERRPSRSRDD